MVKVVKGENGGRWRKRGRWKGILRDEEHEMNGES